MAFNFVGGVDAALGYQQGLDEGAARTQLTKDRAYQDEARNQQRQEWSRQDKLRADLAAIPATETVDLKNTNAPQVDDDGNPSAAALPAKVTQDVPMDVQLRQAAAAKRQAGDMDGWLKAHQQADALMWDRSAKQFQGLIASSPAMNGGQVAEQAASIWNSSNMPFKVSNVKYDDNGGGISVDITNRDGGGTTTRTYKNKDEFVTGMQAMADPATFAKLQEKRAEIASEVAKHPVTTVPGGYVDNVTRQFRPTMVGQDVIGTDQQGNPIYGSRPAPTGGAGAGAGKGGKGALTGDPVQDATAALDSILKGGENSDKLDIDQHSNAREYVARIATQNPKLPAATAARVALEVARDPSKLKPSFNPDTGQVDIIANTGAATGNVVFQSGVAGPLDADRKLPLEYLGIPKDKLANMSPQEQQATRVKAMQGMTQTMLQKMPPAEAAAVNAAAGDASGQKRRELEESIRKQAQDVVALKTAGVAPEIAGAIEQKINAARDARLKALGNSLDLVYSYARPADPSAQKPKSKPFSVGGLGGADSYQPNPTGESARPSQGRRPTPAQSAAQSAAKAAADAEQARRTASEFDRDASTMKPLELLQKWDKMRGSLSMSDAARLKAAESKI